jgi:hypothetical protein
VGRNVDLDRRFRKYEQAGGVDPTTGNVVKTMSALTELGPSDLDFDGQSMWLSSGTGLADLQARPHCDPSRITCAGARTREMARSRSSGVNAHMALPMAPSVLVLRDDSFPLICVRPVFRARRARSSRAACSCVFHLSDDAGVRDDVHFVNHV